jgi:1,4-dihydroxy-2-naphthoate octaprenyltransferase
MAGMKSRPAGAGLSGWWRAARFHFVPPSFLPAALGALAGWAASGRLDLWLYVVVLLAVTFNHVALNMTDDYFDYLHSVDQARDREHNPYSGGSGELTSGRIAPSRMLAAFCLLYGLTIGAGLYLTAVRGWPVFFFGLFGMACAFFYTAPPVRYGYHGLGELSQLANFSLTIGLGSYYVQTRTLSWEAAAAVLPLGLMMFAMITVNEIPDEPGDRQGGKGTLVVRLGPRAGVRLYAASMAAAYLIILAAPLAGLASRWAWLGLATLPWFLQALRVLARHYRDPAAMAPANLLTIRVHNLTGLLLAAGLLAYGAQQGLPLGRAWVALAILLALYLPVALKVFLPARR